jgi:hypothetical protein
VGLVVELGVGWLVASSGCFFSSVEVQCLAEALVLRFLDVPASGGSTPLNLGERGSAPLSGSGIVVS